MKQLKLLSLLLVITLLSTACWSRREIENLGFVMGIGISKTEEGLYSVVAQVANPSAVVAESPEQRAVYSILRSEGLTFFDAIRNLSMVAARRLYIAHVNVLIVDDSIAKEGLSDIVGFLVQDMEARLELDVFISEIPPEVILDTPNTLGVIPAIVLTTIADNYGANSKIYVADLHETVEAVNNPVINYVTTLVEKIPPPSDKEPPQIRFNKLAIFDNDKLKAYLDYEEGQAFNLITNRFKNGLIAFEYATNDDEIIIEVLESSSKITPGFSNGKVTFDIEITIEGNIAERQSKLDFPHQLDVGVVQEQLNKVIEDKLYKAIANAQQVYVVDYFNLSKNFYRKFPKEFKELQDNWNQHFSKADISVKAESSITHSALNLNRGRI
ncbi:Ger(x)C family spore germination protein [Alkaliphilus transvaalensis]|uniref:Ger(x)C family spore germination protein n=1 Tax=Alkaliphilus transvaalensis TaxID=114628 RepID=UPI00047ED5FB|nr:Ger(x)C family spore germination protein [Alkaliphilus transvaalensis]